MACVGSVGTTSSQKNQKTCLEMSCDLNEDQIYKCERCHRAISKEEYETYDGICEECHEIEVDELDYEEGY